MPAYRSFHHINSFAVVYQGFEHGRLQPVLSLFAFDHHQIPDVLGSTSTQACERRNSIAVINYIGKAKSNIFKRTDVF